MKRPLWFAFGLLVAAAVLVSAYVLFTPKVQTATRAQVDAALPPSLKVQAPPDPEARRRYGRLVELVRRVRSSDVSAALGSASKPADPAAADRVFADVEATAGSLAALLREGDVRLPERTIDTRFTDVVAIKDYAKALAVGTKGAAARGDQAACARYADLSLRYDQALLKDGVIIDVLVAVAADAIATRAIYEAEMAGGFDAAGRRAILRLLPAEGGKLPEMGAAVRRDYRQMVLPIIVEPKRYLTREALAGVPGEGKGETPAGTFDPVETARLTGEVYDAGAAEASGAVPSGKAERLVAAATAGLPEPAPETSALGGFWYRLRMNVGRNTLGRQVVAAGIVFDQLPKVALRRAAGRNLVRAVLLLRMGRPAHVPDPYGAGDLQVDPKRRIVWSVGEDGTDDGGDIGARVGVRGPDMGYRY